MTNETKTGGRILTNAIRHLQRTTMNCRTWTMPIGDDQACNILNAAFAEYIRQSNRQFMAQFRIKPWSDEFTINQAFEQGRAAVQGAHNPYSQREGEPWHVENQDQIFDAWARGYRSEHDKK